MAQQIPYGMPPKQRGVGDWFADAFSLFGQNWMVWVLQSLVYLLISALAVLPGCVVIIIGILGGALQSGGGDTATVVGMSGVLGGYALFYVGLIAANTVLMAGMMRTAAKQLCGEAIAVGDLFSARSAVLPLTGLWLLMIVGSFASLCLLGLPLLVLMPVWMLAHPLVVERGLGPLEALKESWSAIRPRFWTFVGLFLLTYILLAAGGSTFIGYFVAFPIYVLVTMVVYRDTFGLPGAFVPGATPVAPQVGNYGVAGPPFTAGQCPVCRAPVATGAVVCAFCQSPLSQPPQS